MLRVLQRACIRAGITIKYTQGFNPHPRLSLPLPKPVGVESDEELLCLRINLDSSKIHGLLDEQQNKNNESQIKTDLSQQLPKGCEALCLSVTEGRDTFQPLSVTYIFPVHNDFLNEKLDIKINRLMASENINVQRRTSEKNTKTKNLDIRDFLKSINVDGNDIIVECRISPAGSIRIEEILELLELDAGMLDAPIRRTNIKWQTNEPLL